ncbi:MAG: hypothetical protein KGH72_01835 [Candidatus Micrarchaeota archaeon]|nr:hypothetical protein [Candidatus Micrarchaeota archaeon]
MAEAEIKTTIDALVSYVNEHGETNVTSVSAALGVGEQTIVEWANILEKANILKIVYKSGKMFLLPVSISGQTLEEMKQEAQAEKSHLDTEISSQLAIVNQVATKMVEFDKSVQEIENIFKTKYKDVKVILDRMNAIESQLSEANKRIKAKSDAIANIHTKLKEDFDGMERYSVDLNKFNFDTNNARTISTDIRNRIQSYKENLNAMQNQFDKVIKEHRNNALTLVNSMKEDVKELEQVSLYDDKQIREYENNERVFKRDAEALLKKVKKERTAAMDEIVKSSQTVQRLLELSSKQTFDIHARLDTLKKDIGFTANLNDGITTIRKQLDTSMQDKEKLIKELNSLQLQVRALNALPGGRSGDKAVTTEKLTKKVNKTAQQTKELEESLNAIDKGVRDLGK